MNLFVSYSFKDDPKFQDVTRLLNDQKLPFFSTSELLSGASLADQLRDRIAECGVCIFIATHNSVKSAWCSAELGAFWGAGKHVVVYVADSNLKETQIPRQFNGHLLERNMHKVIDAARARLEALPKGTHKTPERVPDLSIAQLRELVVEAAQVASQRNRMAQLVFNTVGFFDYRSTATFEDQERWAHRLVQEFIGQSFPASLRSQANGWRYTFNAKTTTGSWHGYALHEESHADNMLDLYRQCLLLHVDAEEIVISAALVETVTLGHRALGMSSWTRRSKNVFALVGQDDLGEAIPELG